MQLHWCVLRLRPIWPSILTVAGIDLSHANIAGCSPEELGLLKDLALFHIDSNRFFCIIPDSFIHLKFLYELDISNKLTTTLVVRFPGVVFFLHSLKCLDVRFNEFEGSIPPQLFDLKLDALSINNNRFQSTLPDNLGNSPVSVFVVANNDISGCIPPTLANMAETLDEIVLSNMDWTGCLQEDVGLLRGCLRQDLIFLKK